MSLRTVVILTPAFPADECDTHWLPSIQNFVRALREGYPRLDLSVVTFHYPYESSTYLWHGVRVKALAGRHCGFPRRLGTWSRACEWILRKHATDGVDVVHSFWLGECTFLAQILTRIVRVRSVATVTGQDALPGNRYLSLLDLTRSTVVTGSEFTRKVLKETTGLDSEFVFPLGLDVDRLPKPRAAADRTIDVLGVGSLTRVKDYSTFIRIVGRLVDRHPGLQVQLIGDGPDRAELERDVRSLNLEENVRLVGRASREKVLETMARSRILIHPARYEAQGYVLMEALASGMHVVKRRVGWTCDSTCLHECGNTDEMAREANHLLESDLSYRPEPIPTANQTAESYFALYSG